MPPDKSGTLGIESGLLAIAQAILNQRPERNGWTFFAASGVSTAAVPVVFSEPFPTELLHLQLGVLGVRTSSDPALVTDFNVVISGEQITLSATSMTRNGFTLNATKSSNFGAGVRYGFWYRAIGR